MISFKLRDYVIITYSTIFVYDEWYCWGSKRLEDLVFSAQRNNTKKASHMTSGLAGESKES